MLLHIITCGKLKNQNIQILKGLNLVFSKNKLIFLIGILGLIVLIAAFFFAKTFFGENEEILFTVLGSMMVIYAHYRNHETCKEIQCKSCHD